MPEGRPLMPRIRMPRITLPGRASRTASEKTTATKPLPSAEAGNGGSAATEAKPAEARSATATPGEATPAAAATPTPNLQERIEGLQGWMAEIERKQARLTYFGGLALLLALAAAGAGLYFGLTAHSDSATKNDLDSLEERVDSLQGAVAKNSKDTQDALNASIAQLQQSISGLQKQQAQASANISTLQSQVASGALNKNATTTPAPTTPGATTTTTTTPNKP
jgi:uncharacterized protein HemX